MAKNGGVVVGEAVATIQVHRAAAFLECADAGHPAMTWAAVPAPAAILPE